jgi:hypothetical protein
VTGLSIASADVDRSMLIAESLSKVRIDVFTAAEVTINHVSRFLMIPVL